MGSPRQRARGRSIAAERPPYEPSAWGKEFHALDVDEALGAGAAGVGKSIVLQMDPSFLVAIEDERCRRGEIRWKESLCKVLFVRRQLNELGETIGRARRMFPRLDPDVSIKDIDGKITVTFRSGMQIIYGGCKDLHDYVQYQGHEYTRIYYDELGEFELEQYEQINTRNRSSDPVLAPFVCVRAASNPTSNWVRKMFVDPAPEGRVVLRRKILRPNGEAAHITRLFLKGTLYDNPNKAFVRDYELKLLSRPLHIRNALLYGDWYSIVGGYYADAWRRDLHVIRPFRIPGHWPRFKILDWGFKQEGCCLWFAVDEDENLICEREFTFRLMQPEKVAERIRSIEEGMDLWGPTQRRSKVPGFADTNLWEDRGSTAESKAEIMARKGVPWSPVDKADKARNAERFYNRLIDHGDGTTMPGIVFFEDCKKTTSIIPTIVPDPNDPDTPLKVEGDHPHDCVLYACAARAKPAKETGKDWYEDEEDDDDDEQIDTLRKTRGQLGYGVQYGRRR